ncbi:MAG TPA: tRNA lysidine(34) synthetase TilS [Gammaproteobacteria bacterium]|nr:tRNA lysidine(34) synthetase TilS [Gammaproteobacteria bacterium]
MRFTAAALRDALPSDITPRRYWIAFSGGVDSGVLLHALAAQREHLGGAELCVVHVNHGLSPQAAQWAEHCARQCAGLGLPFTLREVDAAPATGESPEAAARNARYGVLAELIQAGDCLLTAHHQDDQAETLLLQLLRGAGPRGLAAMPVLSVFSRGWHARPLLGFRRADLVAYAEANGLSWLEDDSNFDTRLERNFLRHDILPRLKQHFPALASTLSRSARRCAEAAEILQAQAQADLAALQLPTGALSVSGLRELGEVRARNVLHHWIHARALPTPGEAQLLLLWRSVIQAAEDAQPLLQWPGAEARRYRDALYIMPPLPAFDAGAEYRWDLSAPLALAGLGRLRAQAVRGAGVRRDRLRGKTLRVRLRRGGERLCVAGREGHHALKKLFQEAGVPPWRRARIPLLFLDDELVAVAGYWVACSFAAQAGQEGVRFKLEEGL